MGHSIFTETDLVPVDDFCLSAPYEIADYLREPKCVMSVS